ncbi:hypothetical protein FACS1894125_6410 [Actinomycetota bacterium]|nr:hypothetical protein FACS1894125_6410 [Actinomycetota bacterium]
MKTINRNGVIAKLVSGLFAVSLVVVLSVGLSSCGEDPIVGSYTHNLGANSEVRVKVNADGTVQGTCNGKWTVDGGIYTLTGCNYQGYTELYMKIDGDQTLLGTRDSINKVLDKN